MDVLMAIAMLCQVSGGMLTSMKAQSNFQLECQKYYIDCYYNKSTKMHILPTTMEQQRFLYQCVQNKLPFSYPIPEEVQ